MLLVRCLLPAVLALAPHGTSLAGEPDGTPSTAAPSWVGAATCAPCHAEETRAWKKSHHDRAMEPATTDTVHGRFDGATFTRDGVTSTFSRQEGTFVVRTDGPDGALHDYPVAWTYGVEPLQQYLVAMPGGRLQALGLAWDTRPAPEGGQRWFHLYPDERIDHRDELHWTGPQQNWNFMCAECHSTNVVKGYDADGDRFATTWTDPDVACEACHGPGATHVAWAEAAKRGAGRDDPRRGLTVVLRSQGAWTFASGARIAHRTAPPPAVEVETCGRCHVRAAQIWEDDPPGVPLADTHRVSLLDPGLYHADGQIDGEVYEYGSFLQSRMYAAGVRCTDCHEPHTARLRAAGNALCAQCHAPAAYDVPAHHHHPVASEGARCVSCHMAERRYMVVDGRRDHSFRVPRPDLSAKIGTPDACATCHRDRPPRWAADTVAGWRAAQPPPGWHWAEAIHAGRTGAADAARQLTRAADDRRVPAIARATAVSLLGSTAGPQIQPALERAARDGDALVRRAAAEAAIRLPPPARAAVVVPLLRDPTRSVRLAALRTVLELPEPLRTGIPSDGLARVVAEHRRSQRYNADRAESWANLGALEARLGNAAAAQAALETAIRRRPSWDRPYLELADVQRRAGDEEAAEATLRRAVEGAPRSADAQAALGMSLVRQQRRTEALVAFRRAAELGSDTPSHAWVYAVALHDTGDVHAALDVLRRAHDRHPGAADILLALARYSAGAGDRAGAVAWARKLAEATGDPSARRLVETLDGRP